MKLNKILFGVAILLVLVNQSGYVAYAGNSITPDDVAVLRAILTSDCRIDRYSRVVSDIPISARGQAPVWPSGSLWAKLTSRVPSGARWPHLNVCPGSRIVDGNKVDSIFSRQPAIPPKWEPFYAAFHTKGLLRLSLPAFTPDRGRAVVYLEDTCDVLCGSGFYIELIRKKAGWKISRQKNAWIS